MLARIVGKSDIYRLKIEIFKDLRNFDFLKINHHEHGNVLVQIFNIERDGSKLIGYCKIIGYRERGVLKNIKTPFLNDAKIEKADDEFIKEIIGLNGKEGGFIGVLEDHPDLKISLDLKKIITKHIAVLAKSGAGKSYAVGVLLEEIIDKNIPVLILDPHNEYSTMKLPNSNLKDIKRLEKFGLKPQGYLSKIKEFSPDTNVNPQAEKIALDIQKLTPNELINVLPQKLTPAQSSLLFNIISTLNNRIDIDEIIFSLSNEEINSKWSLISLLESFKKLSIYSTVPTPLSDIIRYGQASIISLKGVNPEVQEIFVSGLLRELFEARKKEEIPPFFIILEEAHNFAPERSFGEVKSSKIVRTIASEGRKFGIGLCIISQRPAKVDKNVISQCTTQLILKITNPNDLKSVIASSEGVDADSEKEIQRLNIGTALLTGVVDVPLKVNIRPRKSKHGGETVDVVLDYDKFINEPIEELAKEEIIEPKEKRHKKKKKEFYQVVGIDVSPTDAKVLLDVKEVKTYLIPGVMVKIAGKTEDFDILVDKVNKQIIKKIFPVDGYPLPIRILSLTDTEKTLLKEILKIGKPFNPAELLLSTNMMYNEILRVCSNLEKKGLLKKEGSLYKIVEILRDLHSVRFIGNQKFEEMEYDEILEEKISNEEIKNILEFFGEVKSIKDVMIVSYSP